MSKFARSIPLGWVSEAETRIRLRKMYRHIRKGGCPRWHAANAIAACYVEGFLKGALAVRHEGRP